MIDEQWLLPIRTFRGAKNLCVASELATDILRAVRLADEGHEVVLLTLRNLHVQQPVSVGVPLWDTWTHLSPRANSPVFNTTTFRGTDP